MRTRTKLLLFSVFVLLGLLISPLSASAENNPRGLSDKLPKAIQSETIPNADQFSKSDVIEPQQSTTGPLPSRKVIERDNKKIEDTIPDIQSEVTLPVPRYEW